MEEKSKQVKISVIIPVYNVEEYLEECVESVLNQTYTDYEIILVDDGSTDKSGNLCDYYNENFAGVKTIHQKNKGLSAARNAGLYIATGTFVYFLDSDDYIQPMALEHLMNIAEKEDADVVFFDGSIFFTQCEETDDISKYMRREKYTSEQGQVLLRDLLINSEYRTAVPLMLLRKEYLERHKLLFKEGILHEDELFTFLVYNANGRVSHCHESLYARRIRPASIMTSSAMIKRYESMFQIYMELSKLYKNGKVTGEAGQMYMIRTAKSVLGKFNQLDIEEQKKLEQQHSAFKKDVMNYKGFGDMKLKIKCSGGIKNIFYRVENKIMNMTQKV